MKLLLTGGAGFIGHHVVEGVLKETEWDIIILDALNYAGNLNRLSDIDIWETQKHRVKFVWHDLRSPFTGELHKMIGDGLDYVWHLAAETHVDRSLQDAIPFAMSNVVGTTNLLEYIKNFQSALKRYIYFSTDERFGPAPQGVYYAEGDSCNPSNPYSASKEGAEAMSKAFAFSFGVPVTITRTMNCFGERQHPEKFIPKTIRAILNNQRITLHGSPGQTSSRCWIHSRKAAEALIYITDKGEAIDKIHQHVKGWGEYHIVGEEYSVEELAHWVSRIINGRNLNDSELEFVSFHETRPGHDFRYAMSGKKLRDLGFKSKTSFEYSFNKMVNWMIDPKHRHWLNI